MTLTNAALSKGLNYKPTYLKVIGTGYYMAYFFFNKKKAQLQNKRFNVNPRFEIAHKAWNLLDTKGIKQAFKISLPNIKTRKKFYLRVNEKRIDKQYLNELKELVKNQKMSNLTQSMLENRYNIDKSSDISSCDTDLMDISSFNGDLLKESIKDREKNSKFIFINNI